MIDRMQPIHELEVEDKFDVNSTARIPDLRLIYEVARRCEIAPLDLEAVYFDTSDRALGNAGIALRRRSGGRDDGWHIKVATTMGVIELRTPLGDEYTPPSPIVETLEIVTSGESLAPIASLKTLRIPTSLYAHNDSHLAEIVDDHVEGMRLDGIDSGRIIWREWEVEFTHRDAGFRSRIVTALKNAGAVPTERLSKLAAVLNESADRRPSALEQNEQLALMLSRRLDHIWNRNSSH